MPNRILSHEALSMAQGNSIGTQSKYYKNGYWYKLNSARYEGLDWTRFIKTESQKI